MDDYRNFSGNIGNFTKNAVKGFEENIVDKTNYLESIKDNSRLENNNNVGDKEDE